MGGCETDTKIRINTGDRLCSRNGHDGVVSTEERRGKTAELQTGTPRLNENGVSSRIKVGKGEAIEIVRSHEAKVVAFVAGGDYIVGSDGCMIRGRRLGDGEEVRRSINAGSEVRSIAVSLDGRRIVGGLENNRMTAWDAKSHRKAIEFRGG